MTKITVQIGSALGFLGRIDTRAAGLAQVNGIQVAYQHSNRDNANTNDMPMARPETGLLGTVRVATPEGPVAIKDLTAGDMVLAPSGQAVAVSHILKTPTARTAIYLRAPYFGLDHDVVAGPDHCIALTSDIAEYLFGAETVLVPAWAIKDGRRAQHWEMAPNTHLYQVQLETSAALTIGKCAVESMPKSGHSIGKVLSVEEARCFAAEHKSGYQN